MATRQNNRRVESFTKTKLRELQKISICNGTKGEFSFLYVFLKKKKKKSKQADGLKLVIGLLTFFQHYACNLIVLERVAVVTFRRRTEKAHAFIHDQYFGPKVYLCLPLHLFEVTMDGLSLCPFESSSMKSKPQSAENETHWKLKVRCVKCN